MHHYFVGINSVETELIKIADKSYSKKRGIALDAATSVKSLWWTSMLLGDVDALRAT